MPYKIKEIYYTIQGEGANSGRPAVFVRFSGCNLWSGREKDRASAICRFCDTEFVGGRIYLTAQAIAYEIEKHWPNYARSASQPFVVLTGGEPALQVDDAIISELRSRRFYIAIETNGTVSLPQGIHWVTVSPKSGTQLVIVEGNELKLVWPQADITPETYQHMQFEKFYLQPMDGPNRSLHEQIAARYCLDHPAWSLSLQTHKYLGIK